MNITKICYLIIFCCFCQLTLKAQQPLSLEDAVHIGLKNNFDIKIAGLQKNIHQSNRKLGVPERYPVISLNMRQSNRFSLDNSPTSFTDGGYSKNEVSGGVDLEWILFDGFQVRINKERLAQLEDQSTGLSQLVVENTLQAIILAYNKALIEREKLVVVEAVRAYSLQKLTKSKTELQYGDISKYDLYNFENALLQDSINYHVQEMAYSQAIIKLNTLMCVNENFSYRLTGELDFEDRDYKYNELKWKLVANNQDIKNQYINLNLRQNSVALLEAQKKPVFSLRSGISDELNTSKFSGEERENGGVFDFYVSFSLSYKLFDGGKLRRRLQELEIQERIANEELNKLRNVLLEKLQLNFDNYQRQRKVLKLRRKLVKNLSENLIIGQDRLDSGHSLFIEYRDLQIKLLESEIEMLETVFNLKVAETEMIRLIGGISRRE